MFLGRPQQPPSSFCVLTAHFWFCPVALDDGSSVEVHYSSHTPSYNIGFWPPQPARGPGIPLRTLYPTSRSGNGNMCSYPSNTSQRFNLSVLRHKKTSQEKLCPFSMCNNTETSQPLRSCWGEESVRVVDNYILALALAFLGNGYFLSSFCSTSNVQSSMSNSLATSFSFSFSVFSARRSWRFGGPLPLYGGIALSFFCFFWNISLINTH